MSFDTRPRGTIFIVGLTTTPTFVEPVDGIIQAHRTTEKKEEGPSPPMKSDEIPRRVYRGSYEEALFLVSLLQSSDIPAMMVEPPMRGGFPWHSVYVPTGRVADAMPLVEDFNLNGKKTSDR